MSDTRIQVSGGHVLDPLNPNPDDIFIEDIAHALSMQCRFSGHTKTFYSVAEHSVRCAVIVPVADKLDALMHDSSEYALVDVPSPLKNSLFGDQYKTVEKGLMDVIADKFAFAREMPPSVKKADNILLCTEARDLLGASPDDELWGPWLRENALSQIIEPLSQPEAKREFLAAFSAYRRN